MKQIKKTMALTLLMLGFASVGIGAGNVVNSADVNNITANAEIYTDWMCTIDSLGATSDSTSSMIYGEVLEGGVLDLDCEEEFFELQEGTGEGFVLNGTTLTSVTMDQPCDSLLRIDLGLEAAEGDILTINGTFSNDSWGMTIVFNNCSLKYTGSTWVAGMSGSEEVPDDDVPEGYTKYELGGLDLHNNSAFGAAKDWNYALYLQRADGMALPIQEWNFEFVADYAENFKINGVAVTPNSIQSTGDGFYFAFDALNAGDIITIGGTFTCADKAAIYVIEESSFMWSGAGWTKYVEYPDFETGAVVSATGTAQHVYLHFAEGITLPIGSWEEAEAFAYVSGNGVTVNGNMINMHNSVKSVEGTLFLDLGAEANVGDVLKVGGVLRSAGGGYDYVIVDSELTWNGEVWVAEGSETPDEPGEPGDEEPVEYTTYNVGKVVAGSGDTTHNYFDRADGEAFEIADRTVSWTTAFNFREGSGVGVTLNGEALPVGVKFPNNMYIEWSIAPQKGDVLVVGGTFYSETLEVEYVIEESTFIWNGTAWVADVEYTTHDIGALVLHVNSSVGGASGNNTVLYLTRADEGELPVQHWEDAYVFVYESGCGFKVNGEAANMKAMKSTPDGLFFEFDALNADDVVTIGGTFVCAGEGVRYDIEESSFVWTGSAWALKGSETPDEPGEPGDEEPVEYTTYNLGKVIATKDSTAKALNFASVSGDKLAVTDGTWAEKLTFEEGSGVGVLFNDNLVVGDIKIPNDLYVGLGADAQEGDVVVIGGTFYNKNLAVKYVIEESTFTWDGSAWVAEGSETPDEPGEPGDEEPVEYTTYDLGKVIATKDSTAKALNFASVSGDKLAVTDGTWAEKLTFEEGSGVGVLFNDNLVVGDIKIPNDLYVGLGADAQEGDVVVIGGTFYNKNLAVKYVIEESTFTWNGSAWVAEGSETPDIPDEPEVPDVPVEYTEYNIGALDLHNNSAFGAAKDWNYALYLQRTDGMALPILEWGPKFVADNAENFKINGVAVTPNSIQSTGDGFCFEFDALNAGDIITIGGTFTCADKAAIYVIEESNFMWSGAGWTKYVEYPDFETGAVVSATGNAQHVYLHFAEGITLPIDSWEEAEAFAYISGNGVTVNGNMINMQNSVKSVEGTLFLDLGVAANVGDVLKVGGVLRSAGGGYDYVIVDSELTWDGSTWVAEGGETPDIPDEPEVPDVPVEYTTYDVGKVLFASGDNKAVNLYRADGEKFVIVSTENDVNWTTAFSIREGGVGVTFNGVSLSSAVIKFPNDMYIDLGVEAQVGDVLVIGGTFYSETLAVEYIIAESTLTWNGEAWVAEGGETPDVPDEPEVPDVPVEYTTYNVGKVVAGEGDSAHSYFDRADGEAFEIADSTVSWTTVFDLREGSGVGFTLNGEALPVSVKFPNNMYVDWFVEPEVGDVLVIGGTYYSETLAVEYVIEESTFTWNGAAWVAGVEYTTHDIGALVFHVNSTVGAANVDNTVLYLARADEGELPVQNWGALFLVEDVSFFKVNGEVATLYEMKSTADGLYFRFDALNEGDVVTIGGTFVCAAAGVRYSIETSEFTWRGTTWNPNDVPDEPGDDPVIPDGPVEYTTYNVGKVVVGEFDSAHSYFDRADGEAFEIADSTVSWTTVFDLREGSGVGFTLNGESLPVSVKFPNNMYVDWFVEPEVGDVLVIGGTYYSETLAVEYVIEESTFTWNGAAWIANVEFDEYELGTLSLHNNSAFGAAATQHDAVYLQRADGEELPIQSWGAMFVAEDVTFFKVNGEAAALKSMKSTADGLYFEFNELKAGDVVTIGGTFVCAAAEARYTIEESSFVWTGSKWEAYVEYTTYNVGKLVFSSGDTTAIYLDRADGEAFEIATTEDNLHWDTAFSLREGSGVGITLNGVQIDMSDIKFPINMYVGLKAEIKAGDVLVISGTFYSSTLAVEYVIETSTITYNGTTWVDAFSAVKDSAKAELDEYIKNFKQSDYETAEWNSFSTILSNAKASVDAAKTEAEVAKVVADAKKAMDDVLTKAELSAFLTTARKTAKDELAAYKKEKDYKAEEWKTIKDIISKANTEIDKAISGEAINTIVANAKKAIDEVATAKEVDEANLKTWIADAKNEVKEYYEALDLSKYSKEAKATLSGYVASARSEIDKATTKEAIDKIVKDFKSKVDSVEKNVEDKQEDNNEETSSSAAQTQSSGCFGVVGSACAVSGIGLAAAAIVALRKKKEND